MSETVIHEKKTDHAGSNSRRSEFMGGAKAIAPLLVGVFPFGLIYGVLAIECGLAPWQAQAMSSIVFAGSSQIVLCQLLAENAPLMIVFLAISIINLRHILYSASLAPSLKSLSLKWKFVLSYFLTDEAYATAFGHLTETDSAPNNPPSFSFRHWYLLGAATSLWLCWQIATAVGIVLGRGIPPEWGLDFALPLTFIAIVVPKIKNRADWVAVIVSGIAAIAFAALPFKLSLIVATLFGVGAGVWFSRKMQNKAKSPEVKST